MNTPILILPCKRDHEWQGRPCDCWRSKRFRNTGKKHKRPTDWVTVYETFHKTR